VLGQLALKKSASLTPFDQEKQLSLGATI